MMRRQATGKLCLLAALLLSCVKGQVMNYPSRLSGVQDPDPLGDRGLSETLMPPAAVEEDGLSALDIELIHEAFQVEPRIVSDYTQSTAADDVTEQMKQKSLKQMKLHDAERKRLANAPHRRYKRLVMNNNWNKWTNAIVPYYPPDDSVPWHPAIFRAMGAYQRFTCFRFVPWSCCEGPYKNVTTNSRLGLDHEGHLIFVDYGSCIADQGLFRRKQGQTISCCNGMACLHEMGHSLGAWHENQNPLAHPLMRINLDNIQNSYKYAYDVKHGQFSTGYDIQSVMHYGYNTWAAGGHTMTYLASWIKGPGSSGSVDYYYLMQELSLSHNCHGRNCSSFTGTCENDGYLTMVDNRCQCRCPKGLNPATNCATVIGSELSKCKNSNPDASLCESKAVLGWCSDDEKVGFMRTNCQRTCGFCHSWMKYRPWPKGLYALPKTKDGCPVGFPEWKSGSVTHSVKTAHCIDLSSYCRGWSWSGQCTKMKQYMMDHCPGTCHTCDSEYTHNDPYNLQGSISNTSYEQHFCVNDNTSSHWSYSMSKAEYDNYVWPSGSYCIYRYGGQCPSGFKEGSMRVSGVKTASEGFHADFLFSGPNTTIIFCCRDDGYHQDPINLPAWQSFALIANGKTCQEVEGMNAYSGYAVVYVEDVDKDLTGNWPFTVFSRSRQQYRINHCIYYPKNMCGGVYELTPENSTIKISSPRGKNINTECNWLFKGPEGTRLVLDFSKFKVASKGGRCVDQVLLRFNRIGSMPIDFCGESFTKSVSTINNHLMVTFRTWDIDFGSEIDMEVKLMHQGNLCYNTSDHGATYNGKHNYAIGLQQCIPWSEASKCVYNYFSETDSYLEGNYCRNPWGDGLAPWCYTDGQTCERDYCDVCQFEKRYDSWGVGNCNVSNCGEDPAKDLANCALTCKHTLPALPGPILAKTTTCGPPPAIPDADLKDPVKSVYHIGEKVTFKCKIRAEVEKSVTCLSTGVWSKLNYVCQSCRPDWTRFQKRCYKYMDVGKISHGEAWDVCNKTKAHLAFSQSPEENNFLHNFRSWRKEEIWLGANDRDYGEGNWYWDDGTPLNSFNYTNWDSGQPNNYNGEDYMTMLRDGEWRDTTGHHAVICSHDIYPEFKLDDGSSICADRFSTCGEILSADNTTCSWTDTKGTFMKNRCRKTCGICS